MSDQDDEGETCDWCDQPIPEATRYRTSWGTYCSGDCADAEDGCK